MSYTNVPPISLPDNVIPTVTDYQASSIPAAVNEDQTQMPWFENVRTALADASQTYLVNMNISWSAYFASLQLSVPKPPAIIALLPLFRDGAHSAAMVKHGMNIIKQITVRCNPEQIPVLTVDQPLYAIAKNNSVEMAGGIWRKTIFHTDGEGSPHINGHVECHG